MLSVRKKIVLFLVLITPIIINAQENCINGLDDDGDGFIDMNDQDCLCASSSDEIIENGDFGDTGCCTPLLSCYDYWDALPSLGPLVYASCLYGPNYLPYGVVPTSSSPFACVTSSNGNPKGFYQCLTNPMTANTNYNLNFEFFSHDVTNNAPSMANEIGIEIYGVLNCSDISTMNFSCPFSANMDLLFQHVLPGNPSNIILSESTTITPLQNYEAIVFISTCNTSLSSHNFISNISITSDPIPPLDADAPLLTGNECTGYTFEILSIPSGVTIQWYIDGIAVVGEISPIFNLPIGTYGDVSYGFFDAPSCAYSVPIEITQGIIINLNPTVVDLLCFGEETGSIELSPSNGTPPYMYSWSNSSTSNPITNLGIGNYTVTVTDVNGCTATEEFTITEPLALFGNITNINAVDPLTGFGSATASGAGGSLPYNYSWDSGESEATAVNLTEGNHFVTITDDNGCEIVLDVEILNAPLYFEIVNLQNTCLNYCNGKVQINALGGVSPLSIVWDNPSLSEFQLINLCPGIYSFTISDNDNNTVTGDFEILNFPEISISSNIKNPTCSDTLAGAIDITIISGDGPFEYKWSNFENSEDIIDLNNGSYFLTVSDIHQCAIIENFTIFNEFFLNPNIDITPNKCFGDSLAVIDITLIDQANYSILWDDGNKDFTRDSLPSDTLAYSITEKNTGCQYVNTVIIPKPIPISYVYAISDSICEGANNGVLEIDTTGFNDKKYSFLWEDNSSSVKRENLPKGLYSVVVRDSLGCSKSSSINIVAFQPPKFILTGNDPDCDIGNNGLAYIQNLGSSPLSYLWKDGEVSDTIFNLTSGTYSVEITDSNNCIFKDTVTLDQKSSVDIASVVLDEVCLNDGNGSISLTPINGTIKSYTWSNGISLPKIEDLGAGVYNVTITDENDCTIVKPYEIKQGVEITISSHILNETCFGNSNGSIELDFSSEYSITWENLPDTTSLVQNLKPGIYTSIVSDVNGCESLDTFIIEEGFLIDANTTVTPIICDGDLASIEITAINSSSNPSVKWSTGDTGFILENVPEGIYYFDIIDDNNCKLVDTFQIIEGIQIAYESVVTENKCGNKNNGKIDLITLDTFNYQWSNGAITNTISNLAEGDYIVTISDINNTCEVYDTFNIKTNPLIPFDINVVDALCFGDENGSFSISEEVEGLSINGQPSSADTLLSAGLYSLIFNDKNNCSRDTFLTISQPDILESNITSMPISCFDQEDGKVGLSVAGGIPNYSYLWSSGSTLKNLINLQADTYRVTITDGNGCQMINQVLIEPFETILTDYTFQNLLCDEDNSGLIQLSILNGFDPNFFINNQGPFATTDFEMLALGSYNVGYQYGLGCVENLFEIDIQQSEASFTVEIQEELPDLYGYGQLGSITINYTNQEKIAEINVSINGESVCEANMAEPCMTIDHLFEEENIIIATALDDNNCLKSDTLTIKLVRPSDPIHIPNIFSPNSDGINDKWIINIPNNYSILSGFIFDRWGNKVYHSIDPSTFIWDGTFNGSNLQPGVYIYLLEILDTNTGITQALNGDITILK